MADEDADLDIPRYIAHRGASALAIENTLAAFKKVRELGAGGIELDVQLCASGEVVVFHDFNVQRLTGNPAKVIDMPYDELSALPLIPSETVLKNNGGNNPCISERIPTFDMVLELVGADMFIDIELKGRAAHGNEALVTAVERAIMRHNHQRCIVSSFNPMLVRAYKKIGGSRPTSVIYSRDSEVPWYLRHGQGMIIAGAQIHKPDYKSVLHKRRAFRSNECALVWTVDDKDITEKVFAKGARAIITNNIHEFV